LSRKEFSVRPSGAGPFGNRSTSTTGSFTCCALVVATELVENFRLGIFSVAVYVLFVVHVNGIFGALG